MALSVSAVVLNVSNYLFFLVCVAAAGSRSRPAMSAWPLSQMMSKPLSSMWRHTLSALLEVAAGDCSPKAKATP
jgi:hypothetical protein